MSIFVIALLIGFYYDYGKGKPFKHYIHFIVRYILGFLLYCTAGYGLFEVVGLWAVPLVPVLIMMYLLLIKNSGNISTKRNKDSTPDHLLDE